MWYMHEGIGWWMFSGGFWMILFWGGIIALIVWGISRLIGHDRPAHQNHPIDVAKERYARGEITKKDFEQIKRDLS